jgi:hypothetical protein
MQAGVAGSDRAEVVWRLAMFKKILVTVDG